MYLIVIIMLSKNSIRYICTSFFVVRVKKNLQFKCIRWQRRLPKNVLTDSEIELTDIITRQEYPERLWLVKYRDEDQGREFVFLTNVFHFISLEIAELYKNCLQVELFFKQLKQHLKIEALGYYRERYLNLNQCCHYQLLLCCDSST